MLVAKVVKSHRSKYPDPICFQKGDSVIVGESDDEYLGWIKVKPSDGNEGWAPEEYLDINDHTVTAIQDYSAKELNVNVGDVVEVQKYLNAWAWVKESNGDKGWLPIDNLSFSDSSSNTVL